MVADVILLSVDSTVGGCKSVSSPRSPPDEGVSSYFCKERAWMTLIEIHPPGSNEPGLVSVWWWYYLL